MTAHFSQGRKPQVLRTHAEDKLKEGSVQPTHGWLTKPGCLESAVQIGQLAGNRGRCTQAVA